MHITCAQFVRIFGPRTLHASRTPSAVCWINPHQQPMAEPSRFISKKRKLTTETLTLTTHTSKRKKKPGRRSSVCLYENRKWVFSNRDCSNHRDKFVFVSYNILGVENASNHKDLYFDVIPKFLKWEYRRRVIRKEIGWYSPSILCFQEVDRFDDLSKMLHKDGFKGVYQARTGEARDGCAIFWKDGL
ncbi:hypothetical protein L1987_06993 [Smallanthus sonchifolius]|uniref:Uncharacterized protein n=1 Tax=Smallanthus sonchifolius TaxID=185202 RepID=A0ACB9JZV2_9ASTR|nr:hypothetical protein L1987_06993 [Smallanthus sonchifolius]